MIILAVDLAYNHAGWALLKEPNRVGNKLTLLDYDVIRVDRKECHNICERLVFMAKSLSKVIRKTKPEIIVLEDTYSGANAETTAKLNNAKGMALVVIYNHLGLEPVCATALKVRSCLGFKHKENVFDHYKELYKLRGDFKEMNDITDAIALGYYYYYDKNNLCQSAKKKDRKRNKK